MKLKILTTISLILLILNVSFTFVMFGMPKYFENRSHYTAAVDDPTRNHDIVRLKSDAVARLYNGEEVVYEAGTELQVRAYNDDGSLEIFDLDYVIDAVSDMEQSRGEQDPIDRDHVGILTVFDPEFEDVTEEVHIRIEEFQEQYQKELDKEYREYCLKTVLWFIYPDSGGSFVGGIIPAAIAAFLDILLLWASRKEGRYKTFIVVNLFMPLVVCVFWVFLHGGYICR